MENLLVCVLVCDRVCVRSLIPFQSAMTCSLACCPFVLLTLSLSQRYSVCVYVHVWALNKYKSREKTPSVARKKQKPNTQRQGRDKCENKGWIGEAEVAVKLINTQEQPELPILKHQRGTIMPSILVDCCFISFKQACVHVGVLLEVVYDK